MIYKRGDMRVEQRSAVHEGSGDVALTYLLARNTHPNLRLLTYMTVAPGASIGLHHHHKETEYYVLLKGRVVVDDDGRIDTLDCGDLLQTGDGQYHSLQNPGDAPAELLVFVVTHANHPLNSPQKETS